MNDIKAVSQKLLSVFASFKGFSESSPANRRFFLTRDFRSDNLRIGTVFWGDDTPDPSCDTIICIRSCTVDPTKKDSICAGGATRMNPRLCRLNLEVYEIIEDCDGILSTTTASFDEIVSLYLRMREESSFLF